MSYLCAIRHCSNLALAYFKLGVALESRAGRPRSRPISGRFSSTPAVTGRIAISRNCTCGMAAPKMRFATMRPRDGAVVNPEWNNPRMVIPFVGAYRGGSAPCPLIHNQRSMCSHNHPAIQSAASSKSRLQRVHRLEEKADPFLPSQGGFNDRE